MNKLLKRKEVMEILRVSQSTIIRLERKGILKPVKLPDSRTVLYDSDDIQALIQASKESNG